MTRDKTIRTLLITDNDEDNLLVRGLLRESRGAFFEVDTAETFEEGLERLKRNEHDVCLMNDQVEGCADALAATQIAARFGCRVPIIILLSAADSALEPEALAAGAMDTLDKEELLDNLLERSVSLMERSIRYALERRKAEDALRASQERLIEGEMRKDELLAMLAHELRNPLAPIRYALQNLGLDASRDPNQQRQRDMIDRQVRQMARLLDDLLDVSRMTRGRIHLKKEKLDLGRVVDRAVEAVRPNIQEHRQELVYSRLEEPLWVEGEAERLEQVLRNLLYNAIKFSKAGGRIWLSVEREGGGAAGHAQLARVRVVDAGIGIEPEMLPRVFDLFTQTNQSLNHAQGGLGIGLTMVKHLVQMHGGSVRAHSQGLGYGSDFEILLPLLEHTEQLTSRPQAPTAHPETGIMERITARHGGRPLRVLVVEDNLDSANSLAELIELWGHEARAVNDGPAAIEAATVFHPDLVLLDIGLPGMNGYQVARLLRARPALQGAILVALTGYGQDEDRRCAELAGFDQHFTKPIEMETLQNLLQQAA